MMAAFLSNQEMQRRLCSVSGWDPVGDHQVFESDPQHVPSLADVPPLLPKPEGAAGEDPKQLHQPVQGCGEQVPTLSGQCGQQGVLIQTVFNHLRIVEEGDEYISSLNKYKCSSNVPISPGLD